MGRNVRVDGYQVAEPLKGEANVPGPQAELVTARVRSEPAMSLQRRVNTLTLSNPDSNPASDERRIWHRRYHQMQGRRRLSRMRGVSNGVPRDRLDGLATAGRPELPRIRSLSAGTPPSGEAIRDRAIGGAQAWGALRGLYRTVPKQGDRSG